MHNILFESIKNQLVTYQDVFQENLNNYLDFKNLNFDSFPTFNYKIENFTTSVEMVSTLRQHILSNDIQLNNEQHFWTINNWGGIGSFKNTETNQNRIIAFFNGLKKRKLTNDTFSVISSLSKIASFQKPKDYFVYDSRTIYTINWLILKANIKDALFFPMPDSRNSKLTLFDLNTIIAYRNKERILNEAQKYSIKPILLNHQIAYFEYCDLIKYLHQHILQDQPIWLIEILLFTIADNLIFNEVSQLY